MELDRNKIEGLITSIIEAMGYEVWHIDFVKVKSKTLLRIYVDVPLGDQRRSVTIDDCGFISNQVGALLDVEDCIAGSYTLEVSSPGLDRGLFKLEHYQRYIGSMVRIVLKEPVNGQGKFIGKILEVLDSEIKLETDGEVVFFELPSISKAKLIEGERK